MTWFRRKKDRGDEHSAKSEVASDLAEFLAEATEGSALRQAIVARTRELEEGEAEVTDAFRGTGPDEAQ